MAENAKPNSRETGADCLKIEKKCGHSGFDRPIHLLVDWRKLHAVWACPIRSMEGTLC